MERVNILVGSLAACSAGVYVAAIVLTVMRRWSGFAGSLWAAAPAGIAFALDRAFESNDALAALATLLLLAAIIVTIRNSNDILATLLALVPAAVMLLTVVDRFFPAGTQAQLSAASIAILCAPAPLALAVALARYLMTTRNVSVP
jgi:hypothetical protein